jgi:uncharacterized protein YcbX
MSANYTVKELYIYPIKSLAGIKCKSLKTEEMGFENDRRWMLIDEENHFMTQRKYPMMSQFYPEISKGEINVSYEGKKHDFLMTENLQEAILSEVWDDESKVVEVNKATSKWFSEQLGLICKLVKILNKGDRKHSSTKLNKTLNVSLADGYPYLLIGTKSLDFLNEKLEEKISISRFRPNIVITTETPHEEDAFDTFKIGNVDFKNAKRCERCIMINNNPTNGEVKKEPLKTLSTYRKVNNSVLFGTNVVALNYDVIQLGDKVSF